MPQITDPSAALTLFQEAISMDGIPLVPCQLDRDMVMCVDEPNGRTRFSYMKLEGRTVTALVMFAAVGLQEGTPCFNVGYAVPEAYRKQGRAKNTVAGAIREMKAGLGRAGIKAFYVEAVVGLDNPASQKVAADTLSAKAVPIEDGVSGLPALHYLTKFGE